MHRQNVLGIAEAQAEPMIEPHCVADDFGQKSIAMVGQFLVIHGNSLPDTRST